MSFKIRVEYAATVPLLFAESEIYSKTMLDWVAQFTTGTCLIDLVSVRGNAPMIRVCLTISEFGRNTFSGGGNEVIYLVSPYSLDDEQKLRQWSDAEDLSGQRQITPTAKPRRTTIAPGSFDQAWAELLNDAELRKRFTNG